jgi:3-hydroxybutyryl-CoA dehydrogenase
LALATLIGLDVLLAVMQTIHNDFDASKYRQCPLLKGGGELSWWKTGRGVYRY